MKVTSDPLQYRRLRAPQEDGGVFVDPPVEEIGAALAENSTLQSSFAPGTCAASSGDCDYDVQGRSLRQLADQARTELLTAARAYTSSYRNVTSPPLDGAGSSGPIFLAGHQPQLFHPGVWCKSFAADKLAARFGGVAVNLLIDSDVVANKAVQVPGGSVDQPILRAVPLDAPQDPVPYEESAIRDAEVFASFGARAVEVLGGLVREPLLQDYWPRVVARTRHTDNMGLCLAQARHQLEGDWGLETLELPASQVCRQEPFFWFMAHLLAHLPRFFEIYNSSVTEYRGVNRIRSAAHPVPNLAEDGDWLEAPFWIWQGQDTRRRPLFVRSRGDELVLSDRHCFTANLRLTPDLEADTAVSQLSELAVRGVKLRSRALITTMFARLLLSDLFLHGIGGAKYDQLTDLLIQRFFGIRPPRFMTMSATVRLPIQRSPVRAAQIREAVWQLRDRQYNPDRYLDRVEDREAQRWVGLKRQWIATPQTPANARRRCREIRRANAMLQPWVAAQTAHLRQEADHLRIRLRQEAILASREYPFCFYPEEILRKRLLDILS